MTVRRHDPPAGQPPPPEPPSRGIEVRLWSFVGGIVGLLLVCGVVGGVLFLTGDTDPTASTTTTLPTAPRGAVAGAPEVSIEVDRTVLVVTLGDDAYRPGDTYVVKTGETAELADDDQHPLYVRDGSGELEIGVDPGRTQCVTAQLVRDDQRSSWSEVECEEAKG